MRRSAAASALILPFAVFCLLASPVRAADDKCYKEVVTPGALTCDQNNNRSADFTVGCQTSEDTTTQVEVPCTGKWINVTSKTYQSSTAISTTHAQLCARVDMKPADINGAVCASGERRPKTGDNFEGINYKYGTKGDGNGGDGGHEFEPRTRTYQIGSHEEGFTTYTSYSLFCYDPGQDTKNDTDEDAVVAVYCK